MLFKTSSKEKNPKIVVVGAGLAGLTTAYRLHQQGIDVELYEARGRVGGRILTAFVDGRVGELGAQNIADGGEALHIRRLVEEFDFELTESHVNLNHHYFDGEGMVAVLELLKNKQFDPVHLRRRLGELVSTSRNMEEVLKGIIEESDPLYRILATRLHAYEGGYLEDLSVFYAETLYHMLLGGISSAHRCSDEEQKHVQFVSISGGNGQLPKKIADALGRRLHLNMPLKAISKALDGSYKLSFDGHEVAADILVLAIPCSIYNEIAFDAAMMPYEQLQAIRGIRYGTNAKILVPFSLSPTPSIGLVNDESVGFLDVNHSLLTLYYTGEASFFAADSIHDRYCQARPMMENGFGESCPLFNKPSHAIDCPFVKYEGPVGYSWPNDPYAKGTYTYFAPGQEKAFTEICEVKEEKVKTLFAPVDGTLHFAGEHASILMDVAGTMEAACESGERTSRLILKTFLSEENRCETKRIRN